MIVKFCRFQLYLSQYGITQCVCEMIDCLEGLRFHICNDSDGLFSLSLLYQAVNSQTEKNNKKIQQVNQNFLLVILICAYLTSRNLSYELHHILDIDFYKAVCCCFSQLCKWLV